MTLQDNKIVACLKESRNFYRLCTVEGGASTRERRTRLDLYEFFEENCGSRDSILGAISREIAEKLNAFICQTQIVRIGSLFLYKIPYDKARIDKRRIL